MTQLDDLHRSFIRQHAGDTIHRLLLNAGRYPDIDMDFVVRQIEGRKKAEVKLPALTRFEDFIYPVKLSLEQCSSEATARFKALLVQGEVVADLTGGLGIDALFMSQQSAGYCHVERNVDLQQIAMHNFAVCGAAVESFCADGLDFLRTGSRRFDTLYLDPARRDENKNKVVRLDACEPNVPANLELFWQFACRVLVKASPMLDISQAVKELKCVSKVYVVAVRNECKELLFDCCPQAREYSVECVNLEGELKEAFLFSAAEESGAVVNYADVPDGYLYEPNAAIMKAGAFRLIADRYGLEKLHPDTHLYTSKTFCESFPGRVFRIESVDALNKQVIRERLPSKKANVAVRNFPMKPDELKRKFGLLDGGDVYLFAVTLYGGAKRVVFCRKV